MAARTEIFQALAFLENPTLKELAAVFPEAVPGVQGLRLPLPPGGGEMFLYPFGAVVFRDVPRERAETELARLRRARPKLTAQLSHEEFTVREEPAATIAVASGTLTLDRLTPARAGVVALIVAQSAAMEFYEQLVDQMFARTQSIVAELERRGTVSLRTRRLHRVIAEAVITRTEVLSVLHLLDKPDEMWNDPVMDEIYQDLRDEFDLADRYASLEAKSRSIQEALSLVLETARDRRAALLEIAIVLLILIELLLGLAKLL